MEIKVGEYIRTKNGIISKVTDILSGYCIDCDNDVFDIGNGTMMEIPWEYIEEYVIKHSKNIIDLIEAGDVIECSINSLYSKTIKVREYIEPRTNTKYLGVDGFNIKNCKVHKIYTKEQLEEIGYKVKEE